MRSRPGDHGADDQRCGDHGDQGIPAPSERGLYGGCCPLQPAGSDLVGPDGDGDEHHGEKEVRHHGEGVELGHDSDRAERGLRQDAREQQPCRLEQVAAAGAPRSQQSRHDRGRENEGQHPVAELDDAVRAHLGGRHQAGVGAARHLGTAESGAGQPHRAAGHHDAGVGHQGSEKGSAHGGGGGPPTQEPGEAVGHARQPTARRLTSL